MILPLGISFFLFQQIAVICDVRDKKVKVKSFIQFTSFIAFFPQLIAGPIVLYKEMLQQLEAIAIKSSNIKKLFNVGFVLFIFGLSKKILIADNLAPYANYTFANISSLTFFEVWIGAICYSLQLYFDFSGYSDMAIGLGLMFGLSLPINFDTPFKATSMIDFWKRWHITMTRFFTNYLFTPIALKLARFSYKMNYKGVLEILLLLILPIIITFTLSGLWHGANWTFVIFGIVNGLGLILNHIWRKANFFTIPSFFGWLITMNIVVISFVYFRADNVTNANSILYKMFFGFEFLLPIWLEKIITLDPKFFVSLQLFSSFFSSIKLMLIVLISLFLSIYLPNLVNMQDKIKINYKTGFLTVCFFWISLIFLDKPQAFLYFTF